MSTVAADPVRGDSSGGTIRVALADDHPIVLEGLKKLLQQHPDIQVVQEYSDGRRALQALEQVDFDILILDLSLPRVSGIEVLRQFHLRAPGVPVVVMSAYPEDQYARRMMKEGAAGYVPKNAHPEHLLRAIRVVALGGTYFSPTLPAQESGGENRPRHTKLSAREYQVFTLLFQGRAVSDIASELNLAGSTVSNHVAHIREKLGVSSIAGIVSYAHEMGLVSGVRREV